MAIPANYVPKSEETQSASEMLYAFASLVEAALAMADSLRMEIGTPFKPHEIRDLAHSLHERNLIVCEVEG